jgi:hypothetical protein
LIEVAREQETLVETGMNKPIAIILTALVLVVAGAALAAMNNACKNNHHPWCGPHYSARHHVNAERT